MAVVKDEIQLHFEGGDRASVEAGLVQGEIGANRGAELEGIYKDKNSGSFLHFITEERMVADPSGVQSLLGGPFMARAGSLAGVGKRTIVANAAGAIALLGDELAYADDYNGAVLNATTINAAITAIGATKKKLILKGGNWSINANVSVPKNIQLVYSPDAILVQTAAFTVTMVTTPIISDLEQHFNGNSGFITFAAAAEAFPQWWGALTDNATDDGPGITKCLAAATVTRLTKASVKWRLATAVTVAAGKILKMDPASIMNMNGQTLTINGLAQLSEDPHFEFDHTLSMAADGDVLFTNGQNRVVHVVWFKGGSKWGRAFNKAFACRGDLGMTLIHPPDASFSIDETLLFDYHHVVWESGGVSNNDDTAPRMIWTGTKGGTLFQSTRGVVGCTLLRLFFDGAHKTKWTMVVDAARRCEFKKITCARSVGFIYATNCYYSSFWDYTAFLMTPGTYIDTGAGQGGILLVDWQDVCNNGFKAPVTFQSNANTMRIEGIQFSNQGAYELPAGQPVISQLLLLSGQPMKLSLPRFESIDSMTIPAGLEDADKFGPTPTIVGSGSPTGFSTGFTQLSFPVVSGASAANTNSHLLYGTLNDAAGTRTINLYKTQAAATANVGGVNLMATGTRVGDGIVIMHSMNLSGLHGQFTVTYTGNTNAWTCRVNYMTVSSIIKVGGGGLIDIDAVYVEAAMVAKLLTPAANMRGGLSIGQMYLEDCYFSGAWFDSSGLKEMFIGSIVGIGCTGAGNYIADQSTTTHIEIRSAEVHNRYINIGGVNFSDETLNKLGMASTPGSLPCILRPEVESGLVASNSTDTIGGATSHYVKVTPGVIRDGLGQAIKVGRYEELNAITGAGGWLFRPPAGVASYNVCVDVVGMVYVENQAALKGSTEQGKIILATFTCDAAGAITVFTAVASPVSLRGIKTPLTGGLTVPAGPLSAGGHIVMTENDEARVIRNDSADATDNRRLILTGGGSTGNTRGGSLTVRGNEHASNGGSVEVAIGAVAGGEFQVQSNGSVILKVDQEGDARVAVGASSAFGSLGGVVYANATAVGNVGAGADTLMSYSVPASALSENLDSILIRASGRFAASVNNKQLRCLLGADTLFDTGTLAITAASDWVMQVEIIRTGAATQKANVLFQCSDVTITVSVDYTTPTRTLSSANTLEFVGNGTADNDIVQETIKIKWEPAV